MSLINLFLFHPVVPTDLCSPTDPGSDHLSTSAVDRFKNAAFDLVVEGESASLTVRV